MTNSDVSSEGHEGSGAQWLSALLLWISGLVLLVKYVGQSLTPTSCARSCGSFCESTPSPTGASLPHSPHALRRASRTGRSDSGAAADGRPGSRPGCIAFLGAESRGKAHGCPRLGAGTELRTPRTGNRGGTRCLWHLRSLQENRFGIASGH